MTLKYRRKKDGRTDNMKTYSLWPLTGERGGTWEQRRKEKEWRGSFSHLLCVLQQQQQQQRKVKSVCIHPLAAHHRPAVCPELASLSLCVWAYVIVCMCVRVCVRVCVFVLWPVSTPDTSCPADLMRRVRLPCSVQTQTQTHKPIPHRHATPLHSQTCLLQHTGKIWQERKSPILDALMFLHFGVFVEFRRVLIGWGRKK